MRKSIVSLIGLAAVVGAFVCLPAVAQVAADPSAVAAPAAVDTSGVAGFFVGVAAKFPWLATVLLVIGGLRVVFKPTMTLIDGYIKANCSPDEYAKLQSFEAGPVYKWLNFGLDFVGSVKLPVLGVKPDQK